MFDYLIVGAGFAGSVVAERLAAGMGKRVLLVERRPHIAGNAYDHYDDHGILVHRYGPHIFHTNSAEVFAYLSRFTTWRPYTDQPGHDQCALRSQAQFGRGSGIPGGARRTCRAGADFRGCGRIPCRPGAL